MNMMVAVSCNRFLFFKLGDIENKKELKVMEPLAIERGQTIPLMPRRQWKAKGVSFFFEMFSLFTLVCMGGGHCIYVEVRGQILTLYHMDLGMELKLLALDLHLLGQPASPRKVYIYINT